MHVHVGRESLGVLELKRLVEFVNHRNGKELLWKMAGRSNSSYAQVVETNSKYVLREQRERYRALNLAKEHTVEFRIFQGTLDWNRFLRNLEFVDAACYFVKDGGGDWRQFSEWMMKKKWGRWPRVESWLGKEGLAKGEKLGRDGRPLFIETAA